MNIDILEDVRTDSLSVIYADKVENYLLLVENAYKDQGGIEGQRRPLKTKTGQRIRSRMVDDIKHGTILPPIVLGVVVDQDKYDSIKAAVDVATLSAQLNQLTDENLSIIDGMQRTTAILEANENNAIANNPIRVELWISTAINNLIYRMLILNTGQVPWDIKRQLQTIYKPLLAEVKKKIATIEVFEIDDNARRSQAGQFQASRIVEYFLSFTSRKTNVDTKEKVADDFARMDAAEAIAKTYYLSDFITILNLMTKIDHEFARAKIAPEFENQKISTGRDIFTSAPSGHGFVAAAAVKIFGRPGMEYSDTKTVTNRQLLLENVEKFIEMLTKMTPEQLHTFLDLPGLNEKLSKRSGKVGEFERDMYFKAFEVIFEEGDELTSMAPCWEAY